MASCSKPPTDSFSESEWEEYNENDYEDLNPGKRAAKEKEIIREALKQYRSVQTSWINMALIDCDFTRPIMDIADLVDEVTKDFEAVELNRLEEARRYQPSSEKPTLAEVATIKHVAKPRTTTLSSIDEKRTTSPTIDEKGKGFTKSFKDVLQKPVAKPGQPAATFQSINDFLEPLWTTVGKKNKPVTTGSTCRNNDDYIQESESYREETDSDAISGLEQQATESEMAATSQAQPANQPKYTPIVYTTTHQAQVDDVPLEYHVQKGASNYRTNNAFAQQRTNEQRFSTEHQRQDNHRPQYQRLDNQRSDSRPRPSGKFRQGPKKINFGEGGMDKRRQRSARRWAEFKGTAPMPANYAPQQVFSFTPQPPPIPAPVVQLEENIQQVRRQGAESLSRDELAQVLKEVMAATRKNEMEDKLKAEASAKRIREEFEETSKKAARLQEELRLLEKPVARQEQECEQGELLPLPDIRNANTANQMETNQMVRWIEGLVICPRHPSHLFRRMVSITERRHFGKPLLRTMMVPATDTLAATDAERIRHQEEIRIRETIMITPDSGRNRWTTARTDPGILLGHHFKEMVSCWRNRQFLGVMPLTSTSHR